jgi:hypothetical protein
LTGWPGARATWRSVLDMQRPHPAGRFEVDRAAARNALTIQARRSVWPRPGIYQMLPCLQANQLARPTTQAFQAKRTGVHFFQVPHWARLGDGNRARTLSAGKDKQVKGFVKVASHVAPPQKTARSSSVPTSGQCCFAPDPGTKPGARGSGPATRVPALRSRYCSPPPERGASNTPESVATRKGCQRIER